jgi:thiamine-phosphate pyrophosphorylase
MLRYAITDRFAYDGNEDYRQERVVLEGGRWAAEGIDFLQIREKDLGAGAQAELTRRVVAAVRRAESGEGNKTRVLVNSRVDVALAAGADGVHLTAAKGELTAAQVRRVFAGAVVSVSCHSVEEVERARDAGVDVIVFGPVFEKRVEGRVVVSGVGLEVLARASRAAGGIPVVALGGVTMEVTGDCLAAGAAGVAGIRLFRAG